jgi:hypothetical protein
MIEPIPISEVEWLLGMAVHWRFERCRGDFGNSMIYGPLRVPQGRDS